MMSPVSPAIAPALSLIARLPQGSRIAVLGSRSWAESDLVEEFVAGLPKGAVVVSGAASGVDTLAVQAARRHGHQWQEMPADWARFGQKAGILRTRTLLHSCNAAVIFCCCESKGSMHSTKLAHELRVPVVMIRCSCASDAGIQALSLWG